MRTIPLPLVPVTADGFARFGVLPPDEGDGRATADLEFTRADGWVNYIGHTLAEIDIVDGAFRCDLLNRHDTHTQTLMPMSGDALIVVAPADVDFSDGRRLRHGRAPSSCRSTRASTSTAERGIGGRIPSARDTLRIFNIQGRGYPTDNARGAFRAGLRSCLRRENELGLKFLKLGGRYLDHFRTGTPSTGRRGKVNPPCSPVSRRSKKRSLARNASSASERASA